MLFDWQGRQVRIGDVVEVYLYYDPESYDIDKGHYVWKHLFSAKCLGTFMSIKTPNEDILIDAKHFFEYYATFNNAVIALSDTDSCKETSFFLEYFS